MLSRSTLKYRSGDGARTWTASSVLAVEFEQGLGVRRRRSGGGGRPRAASRCRWSHGGGGRSATGSARARVRTSGTAASGSGFPPGAWLSCCQGRDGRCSGTSWATRLRVSSPSDPVGDIEFLHQPQEIRVIAGSYPSARSCQISRSRAWSRTPPACLVDVVFQDIADGLSQPFGVEDDDVAQSLVVGVVDDQPQVMHQLGEGAGLRFGQARAAGRSQRTARTRSAARSSRGPGCPRGRPPTGD